MDQQHWPYAAPPDGDQQSQDQLPPFDHYDVTGTFDFSDIVPPPAIDPALQGVHALDFDLLPEMQHDLLPTSFYGMGHLPANGSTSPEQPLLPFESSIPHYFKPDRPCQHCASRQLECKVFRTSGNDACTSCTYLFRPCSFVDSPSSTSGRVNLLHVVNEGEAQEAGLPSRVEPLYAAGASASDISREAEPFSLRQEKTGRFSRQVLQVLRTWLVEHSDHPYPTEDEKVELGQQTGLTRSQISNWLANARRRGKVRPRVIAEPLPIPRGGKPLDQSDLTPFDRWKSSPPENEASIDAIQENAASTDFASDPSTESPGADIDRSSACSAPLEHHPRRCPSDTSCETLRSQSSLSLKSGSLLSRASSDNSCGSYNSFTKKDRRRRTRPSAKHATAAKKPSRKRDVVRPFQCTMCIDSFFTKFDWTRHEKSVHLNLEKWICAPNGFCEHDRLTGITMCAYCGASEPTAAHAEFHDHSTCVAKGADSRVFLRKDHLRQHLRLVHCVRMSPHMDNWRSTPRVVRSRCGFCDATFTSWDDRASHLAGHFRRGTTMSSWQGGWGFDPDVEACVSEAIPPPLIEAERRKIQAREESDSSGPAAPQPGRRNNASARPHPGPVQLTAVLRHFVTASQGQGVAVTDDMLREHARQVIHGNDGGLSATRADDPAWLDAFKSSFLPKHDTSTDPFRFDTLQSNQVQGHVGEDVGTEAGMSALDVWSPGEGTSAQAADMHQDDGFMWPMEDE